MTNIETSTRKFYRIDVKKIEFTKRAGGNIRTDFAHLKEMTQSIFYNGIEQPIRAYRNKDKPGYWLATNGETRLKGSMILLKDGFKDEKGVHHKVKEIFATVEPIDGNKLTDSDIVFGMFTLNSGKPLNDIETATGVKRLIDMNETPKAIAAKVGKSLTWVYEMQRIPLYPDKVKEMILKGEVSRTLCSDILKSNGGDLEDLENRLTKSMSEAKEKNTKKESDLFSTSKSNGGDLGITVTSTDSKDETHDVTEAFENSQGDTSPRITAKIVSIKKDSFKAVKNALKDIEKKKRTIKHKELHEVLSAIVNNEYDKEYIIALLTT